MTIKSFQPKFKITLSILSLVAATYAYALGQSSSVNPTNFEVVKNSLWQQYLKDAQYLSDLKSEYDMRALKFKDKTMRFSLERRGVAPEGGYPLYIALHGGGQTSTGMNNSQWEHMKIYYRDSVKDGIYVATRGITDNWNLHFEEESYPLYDKLIESAILFEGVNPNRVYFMGFSAGGDGVYQVVPRMPNRFAAANMSAGHHNWIKFDNLYNTPFLIQVGELDAAYKRNHVAAENFITLNNLNAKYHGGYIHDAFIHYNGYHNGWYDNDALKRSHTMIADPIAWHANNIRTTILKNTNAVDWMNQYERDASPNKLVWDMGVGANERVYQTGAYLKDRKGYEVKDLAHPKALFYWLDVSVAEHYPENGKLVVELDKTTNTIKVIKASDVNRFRILLNPNLLNLLKPIKVEVTGKLIGMLNVVENKNTMVRTMLERSDKDEIYDGEVILDYNKVTKTWKISS